MNDKLHEAIRAIMGERKGAFRWRITWSDGKRCEVNGRDIMEASSFALIRMPGNYVLTDIFEMKVVGPATT